MIMALGGRVVSPSRNQIEPVGGRLWNATLYDEKHSWVWKSRAELLDRLSPKPGENILDLGCGTGHLTHQIARAGANVVGLDRSFLMIQQARGHYPELRFVMADASCFAFSRPFDAVFSNSAIHWVKDRSGMAACIAAALRTGGRFIAEFGGKGNSQAILEALEDALQSIGTPARFVQNRWYSPSIGEFAGLLEMHGLAVRSASLFDRPTHLADGEQGLENWLNMFAGEFLSGLTTEMYQELLGRIKAKLRADLFRDGSWYADRRGIFVTAIRE